MQEHQLEPEVRTEDMSCKSSTLNLQSSINRWFEHMHVQDKAIEPELLPQTALYKLLQIWYLVRGRDT